MRIKPSGISSLLKETKWGKKSKKDAENTSFSQSV